MLAHAVAASLSGGITGAAFAWIDGGEFSDIMRAFGIGFVTGILIYFACVGVGAVTRAISNRIRGGINSISQIRPDQRVIQVDTDFVPPNRITGYTRHGLDQAMFRDMHGVNPRSILNTTRNPITRPVFDPLRDTWRFTGVDSIVVLNRNGRIVTAWATSPTGWRW